MAPSEVEAQAQGRANKELVWLDETVLHHILTNLVSNALKYSPADSPVELGVYLQKDKLMLEVKDQGRGIAEQDQLHLFTPFYRASNVGTLPGTGLGLSIVKKAVELHRGRMELDSKLGKGTTFRVILPLNLKTEG